MATVSGTGITPTTLDQYIALLETAFKNVFGQDLDVSSETPQGQLIGIIAFSLTQTDEGLVSAYSATSIFAGFGQQLDALFSTLGVPRNAAQRSVVNVDLTGVATTLIPAGTRAKTINGDEFRLIEDAQLDGSGNLSTSMESVVTGAIPAEIGELTSIVDIVVGWETITNPTAAVLGVPEETDSDYRARYQRELSKNAIAPIESIVGRVSTVTGVSDVAAGENDTSAPLAVNGVTIPPHSVAVVVEGGTDQEIAEQIQIAKTGGTGTDGDVTVPITYTGGMIDIKFYRSTDIPFELDLNVTFSPTAPGNAVALIKERIEEYVNGSLEGFDQNIFETDGINIGETLYEARLFTPINSVPGVIVNTISLKLKSGGGGIPSIAAKLNEKVILESQDDINITVV